MRIYRYFTAILVASSLQANAATESVAAQGFLASYAGQAYAQYSKALLTAEQLQLALVAFTDSPSPETHQAAKDAWNEARSAYLPTEAFRFADGPIDREGGPEGLINSWPLDEAAIDYVLGDSKAGIINNPDKFPLITAEKLAEWNQLDGETSVTAGYHAIEFLLWGQDNDPNGPGRRSYLDFFPGRDTSAERRAQYLIAAADLLVVNLQEVAEQWNPANPQAYVHEFLDPNSAQSTMLRIVNALAVFTGVELSGERLFTAYEIQHQEEEQSCFSDTTMNDFKYDFLGVMNLLNDSPYGNGLLTLLRSASKDKATALESVALRAGAAIQILTQWGPFDQAILNPQARPMILDALTQLELLSEVLKDSQKILESAD